MPGRPIVRHGVPCASNDGFYDRTSGGPGLSSVRQPLADNLSPTPMSTGSLLSYYRSSSSSSQGAGNSSASDSPLRIGFQHETEADDPMGLSTPMSAGSLLSYYCNGSNSCEGVTISSVNSSPPCISLQHEEPVTGDPMELSDASANVVCTP